MVKENVSGPQPDDDTVLGLRAVIDDDTVLGSRVVPDDDTVLGTRVLTDDDTVLGSRAVIDDDTALSSRAALDDDTALGSRAVPNDDTALGSRGGATVTRASGRSPRRKPRRMLGERSATTLVSGSAQVAYDPGETGVADTTYSIRKFVEPAAAPPATDVGLDHRHRETKVPTDLSVGQWRAYWASGIGVIGLALAGLIAILVTW